MAVEAGNAVPVVEAPEANPAASPPAPDDLRTMVTLDATEVDQPEVPDVTPPGYEEPTIKPDDALKVEPEPQPEPEPEPAPEPEKPAWDKARQAKDQELANLRKENEALRAKMLVADEPVPETEPLPEMDDFSDGPLLVKHLKALKAENAEIRDILEQKEALDAYNGLLTEVCKFEGVGEEKRNYIDERMKAEFSERGYRKGHLPPEEQTRDLIYRIGQEIVINAMKAQVKPRPKPKTGVPEVKGGAPVATNWTAEIKEGTPEEVSRQLKEAAERGIYPPGWVK